MTKKPMSKHEEAARICGWMPIEQDGVQFVRQPEHGWLAPYWEAACDPDFKTWPWLAWLRVSHPGLFA